MSSMTSGAATLIAGLVRDVSGIFPAVVSTYQAPLYRFVLRYCGDPRDAEEITQDTFLRAYKALASYDTDRISQLALRPWLYQIALNCARNHARRRTPVTTPLDHETDDQAAPGNSLPSPGPGPEHLAEQYETSTTLATLVVNLPARYRAAVILRHIVGLSYPEIAVALEQPPGTVKANVHRGSRLLREAWQAAQRTEGNRP